MKELLSRIIVKTLTSNVMAFLIVFVSAFVVGLVIFLVISLLGGVKEMDIGPLLIVSLLLGLVAVGLRFVIMRRFSRVGA